MERGKTRAQRALFNGVCFFGSVLLGLLLTANQALYYAICVDLGLSAQLWTGVLHACLFAGMTLSCLVVGELCEHLGKKRVFLISALVTASGGVLLWLARGIVPCIVGYVLLGCGFGVMDGQTTGLLADENPGAAARMSNFNSAFFSLGAVLSPILINGYLDKGGTWQRVYMITALLFLLLCALYATMRYSFRPTAAHKELVSLRVVKSPLFLLAGLCLLLYAGAEAGASSWTTQYFTLRHGSGLYAGAALSLFWAFTGVGRIIAGMLGNRYSLLLWLGGALGICGIAGILLIPDPAVSLICYAVAGFGFGPLWPTFFALAIETAGPNTGAASGIAMLFSSLGGTLIPLLLGLLQTGQVFVASIVLLCGVLGVYRAFTALQKRQAES